MADYGIHPGELTSPCALRSGIPPCCREWWCRVWAPLDVHVKCLAAGNRWTRRDAAESVYYIRCPSCLQTGARTTIKLCAVKCDGCSPCC